MKKINTTTIAAGVAYPPSKKGFDFLQSSYQQVLGAIAQGLGGERITGTEKYVLYGCKKTDLGAGNFAFEAGWIMDGNNQECYYFAGTASINITLNPILTITTTPDPTADPTTFTDGSSQNVHDVRTLVISNAASGYINYDTDLIFVNSALATSKVFKRVINIGDWNMDSTVDVLVAHGLTDFKKIRAISAIIRNDADTQYYTLINDSFGTSAGFTYISATASDIVLRRAVGSVFDGVDFDSTSYNRGFITIEYIL